MSNYRFSPLYKLCQSRQPATGSFSAHSVTGSQLHGLPRGRFYVNGLEMAPFEEPLRGVCRVSQGELLD